MKRIITFFFILFLGKVFSQNTVYIPVVFHVVYNNSSENIQDSVLVKQIQSLNYDFSDTSCPNTYTKDVNTNIQFCLATLDSTGNPTNGITRTSSTHGPFSSDDAVKFTAQGGHDAWDRDMYLNIWVCNMGGGLLGYGTYPAGTAATDGIVAHCNYLTGGALPYNFGRAITHNLGHWLDLRHPNGANWCTDGDGISDTPIQSGSASCGQFWNDTCCGLPDSLLAKNFMSYGEDACLCFFTPGQKAKMWTTLNGPRAPLLNALGCGIAGVNYNSVEHDISIFPNPSIGKFNLTTNQLENLKIKIYNVYGECILQQILTSSHQQIDLSFHPNGIYFLHLSTDKGTAVKKIVISR